MQYNKPLETKLWHNGKTFEILNGWKSQNEMHGRNYKITWNLQRGWEEEAKIKKPSLWQGWIFS